MVGRKQRVFLPETEREKVRFPSRISPHRRWYDAQDPNTDPKKIETDKRLKEIEEVRLARASSCRSSLSTTLGSLQVNKRLASGQLEDPNEPRMPSPEPIYDSNVSFGFATTSTQC